MVNKGAYKNTLKISSNLSRTTVQFQMIDCTSMRQTGPRKGA